MLSDTRHAAENILVLLFCVVTKNICHSRFNSSLVQPLCPIIGLLNYIAYKPLDITCAVTFCPLISTLAPFLPMYVPAMVEMVSFQG